MKAKVEVVSRNNHYKVEYVVAAVEIDDVNP